MPYLDSVFVTDEQHQRIARRCEKINGNKDMKAPTFSEALAMVISDGLDVMDAVERNAVVEPVPRWQMDAAPIDPPGDSAQVDKAGEAAGEVAGDLTGVTL